MIVRLVKQMFLFYIFRSQLLPMMENPACKEGLGEDQDIFMLQCLKCLEGDAVSSAKSSAEQYIALCR